MKRFRFRRKKKEEEQVGKAVVDPPLSQQAKKEVEEKESSIGLHHITKDEWEVPHQSIKLEKKIDAGLHGDVWQGLWNGTTPVTIKTHKSGFFSKEDFLSEAALLKRLTHPNIIQLCCMCTDKEPLYLVTEFMKHGSLLDYLRDSEEKGRRPGSKQLRLPQLVDMAAQIAKGMAYLESQNCIHRDVAARNILVGDNNLCKVARFDISRFLGAENEYIASEEMLLLS
eukprot:m.62826 g.62826  ORF g.62826 m.62826 type:complete len:226 (-) comp8044_c0_seq2:962-1639(-)